MSKIVIKHLGPITSFEAEIGKINLLIGEQATGKSTISKAVYFFRMIKDELITHLLRIAVDGKLDTSDRFLKPLQSVCKSMFIQLFGYSWDLDHRLEMKYEYANGKYCTVRLNKGNHNKKYISVAFSDDLVFFVKGLENRMLEIFHGNNSPKLSFTFVSSERARIHSEITQRVNAELQDDLTTYYIPAGRGLLTLMANQKTKLDYDAIDLVNLRFMQFIENIQTKFDDGIQQVHRYYPMEQRAFDVSKISAIILNCLKGDYKYSNGNEYFITPGSDRIPINFASSGQQEALWLFNQLYVLMLRGESSFVIIEEPEAHLYPTLQKEILDFIVQFAQINNSIVFITTHSPYMLTATNTLYCAGRLMKTQRNKIEKIMGGKYRYILPQQLVALKLSASHNQTIVESLLDTETNELKTSLIDEVSDRVNEAYTALYYLEMENENTTSI